MSARPTDLLRLKSIVEQVDALMEVIDTLRMTEEAYVSPSSAVERIGRSAVDQHMTQLCEQAREVTDETRERMGGIPWTSVAEMRNYLVHAYDSLRADEVWRIIAGGQLGELRDACEACADEIERGDYMPAYKSRTAERRAKADGALGKVRSEASHLPAALAGRRERSASKAEHDRKQR